MPRKDRVARQTRAERMLAAYASRCNSRTFARAGEARILDPRSAYQLLDVAIGLNVDHTLEKAVEDGFLGGTLSELREQLFLVIIEAASRVIVESQRQVGADKIQRHIVRMKAFCKLSCELSRDFRNISDEIDEISHKSGYYDDSTIFQIIAFRAETLAETILYHLDDIPATEPMGPNTNFVLRIYSRALQEWWLSSAHGPSRRGAKKCRNGIAEALWADCTGQPIARSGAEWASRMFREL